MVIIGVYFTECIQRVSMSEMEAQTDSFGGEQNVGYQP
ncbi:hypothetical protein ATPR_2398 [Acetobacter tropicalis NBRC 101654]|uniref:Uncharacterized protein n=1 Tax=Acetobacter tropicalis NBRC 101654 TaxID=749388 RepID=F7VG99_9PROT|nr:hypothetical protein ATPR_2398 [Acetobacter tropicalis NBRC 101654]